PHSKIKIEHYTKPVPIFSNFGVETQVQTVYKRKVTLPSGGNVIFDTTEALTSIDVNSAKSTKGGDIEETALNTNLEAAISIATQLRLRDVGGLIVVDFIDMIALNSQKSVMRKMAELSKIDKAKIQFSRISKFGLMEISRQKLKSSIMDTNNELCHTCSGTGNIKSLTTLSVSLVRILEEEAMKNKKPLTVYLPVRLATYLLNEKRDLIQSIEERQSISIKVVPDPDTEGSGYHIDREGLSADAFKASLKNKSTINEGKNSNLSNPNYQEALVKTVTPKTLPPKPSNNKKNYTKKIGFFRGIINKIKSIFGIKPKRQYKGKQYYSRRRFNNKNNYSKYNKYKSFNKKKNYYPKNNANNKQNTANSSKSANSD
nr:ribonuclease E/G [Pelagibacterales bacterium]